MANWRMGRVISALLILVAAVALTTLAVSRLYPTPPLKAREETPLGDSAPVVGEGGIRYDVDVSGSEARYRVREQLAGMSFFQDAVGVTQTIRGGVSFDEDGSVLVPDSAIAVDLSTLTSDQSRRDRYIQNNTLQTNIHPEALFVPRHIEGLPFPLPEEGSVDVIITGDLTLRGITKRQQWPATIHFEKDAFTVHATQSFPFGDFDMTPPRVAIVLSVDDEIRLEAQIRLEKQHLSAET